MKIKNFARNPSHKSKSKNRVITLYYSNEILSICIFKIYMMN